MGITIKPQISIIAAMDRNNLISDHGKLPWNLPADVKHFQQLTLHKPVIMGRKTYEAIGHPLSGRRNIIISNDEALKILGAEVYTDINLAINACKDSPEIMVIGGASIYEKFLPLTNKMYLTIIKHTFKGDRYFPKWNPLEWQEIERHNMQPDAENLCSYIFVTYLRKKLMV